MRPSRRHQIRPKPHRRAGRSIREGEPSVHVHYSRCAMYRLIRKGLHVGEMSGNARVWKKAHDGTDSEMVHREGSNGAGKFSPWRPQRCTEWVLSFRRSFHLRTGSRCTMHKRISGEELSGKWRDGRTGRGGRVHRMRLL
jgi:hypothetical protein